MDIFEKFNPVTIFKKNTEKFNLNNNVVTNTYIDNKSINTQSTNIDEMDFEDL